MRSNFLWIVILIMLCVMSSSLPVHQRQVEYDQVEDHKNPLEEGPKVVETAPANKDGEVISVRITSSVAVNRGNTRHHQHRVNRHKYSEADFKDFKPVTEIVIDTPLDVRNDTEKIDEPVLPQELVGANIEFIKQLKAKKDARGLHDVERIFSFEDSTKSQEHNDSEDSAVEESESKSVLEMPLNTKDVSYEVPQARSVAQDASQNSYIQDPGKKPLKDRRNNQRLTTAVSFNIVHNTPKSTNFNDHTNTYLEQSKSFSTPAKVYSEPPKVYSQPAKVYSEPAKFYSEPAKYYSEPAKIYSEPAKFYSEPARIYSEPAKFYSKPASLHLPPAMPPMPWKDTTINPDLDVSSTVTTTPVTLTNETDTNTERHTDQQPEKNYEVDEKVSVMTDGRSHGVQEMSTDKETNPENCMEDNCKVGYVVEGRQYRKYRVEERTPDGFIVGEYGVVRNEDGALRGVRYTADSEASPRLIYDALMKFLQLK